MGDSFLPTASAAEAEAPAKAVRFRLAFQRNRALAYAMAAGVGLLSILAGTLHAEPGAGAFLAVSGIGSAIVLSALVRRAAARGRSFDPVPFGLILDPLLISGGVALSGGLTSPWYLWYLAAVAPAAFTMGRKGTAAAALFSAGLYLATLVATGDIRGLGAPLADALTRMVFLGGAAGAFLVGVTQLQDKRALIRKLRDEESRKVEELRRLAASLDSASEELGEAANRVREADRLKSQFLANMSHELRTPLNSIIGFAEILRSRLEGKIEPKQARFLEHIATSGHHLLKIINDILDLSKIEAGRMELRPEPLPLLSVVEGVCHVVRGMAARTSISLEVRVPPDLPPLEADPVKLRQVLYNLLSNAVKFSPEGAAVTVAARSLPSASSLLGVSSIEISVEDRGIGIAPEHQEAIFGEFRQIDGEATRRFDGTGLGLALVRKLVALHRGAVSVRSAPGEGSTFVVVLPRVWSGEGAAVEAVRPAEAVASPEPLRPGPKPRVLVVEDEGAAFEALAAVLRDAGWLPLRARTGEEAVMLGKALHPDAITLDILLPGLDGWEVLKALKADPETASIPVVVVSMTESRELGVALGAADYLLKPVDRDQLLARLSSLLPGALRGDAPVLVVDDDPAVHELLGEMLRRDGWETCHATTGSEALERARAMRPALVVLDLAMDGMDGFEVAERLATDPATAEIPVVVLTAREVTPEDRARLAGRIRDLVPKGDPAETRRRLQVALSAAVRLRKDGTAP
ncbi:MAG: response regulator [Holophagales bacterium]|nr:response regulator [Holophagales bacterium]MBK9965973.1 response regulator [Holophagales bacterium]